MTFLSEESLARARIPGYRVGVMLSMAPVSAMAVGFLAMAGCSSVSESWTTRRDASTASNRMMLVRETPDTLGYRRLIAKSQESGDLKIFIDQTGMPDFLAEANNDDREYLIFYYLKRHQAFACRTKGGIGGGVEFSGPYAMTPGEMKMLTEAKKQADQVAAGG